MKKLKQFKVSITLFLSFTFIVLLLMIVAAGSKEYLVIERVKVIASEAHQEKLPELLESQKTLANIESLRRLSQVCYSSASPFERRQARINAQAMASESIFEIDSSFRASALALADDIALLEKTKTKIDITQRKIDDFSAVFNIMLRDISLVTEKPTVRNNAITILAKNVKNIDEQLDVINKFKFSPEVAVREYAVNIGSAMTSNIANIAELAALIDSTKSQYEEIDLALRTMRDNVTKGSEFSISNALTEIMTAAEYTKILTAWLFGFIFFLLIFYMFLVHNFLTKPIRWFSRQLKEIQQGRLDVKVPNINISELSEVSNVLVSFSHHLMDLYNTTHQLQEDVAVKKDLEEVMRAVFRVSLDGYIVWNMDDIEDVSVGTLEILGLNSSEEFLQNWHGYGLSRKHFNKIAGHINRLNGPYREELLMHSSSNEHIPMEATHIDVVFRDKPSILTYLRDLRIQKKHEEALEYAKDQAEIANQGKSEFLARMSHEIRTPMNGVLGLTHIALQEDATPRQHELLTKIQSSAKLLLRIINDILDFSKIESGKMLLEEAEFSIDAMLININSLLSQQATSKGIEFNIINVTSPDQLYWGDSLRLIQILLNLIGNGIKFTSKGSVTLYVEVAEEDEHSVLMSFSILDTGIGLTSSQLQKLFQPFAQADSSTTRKYGGTGLGLMISKRLVEIMGGTINVESEINVGSKFHFSIPLIKYTGTEEKVKKESIDTDFLKNKRILVAEDNSVNQIIIRTLLSNFGIDVTIAEDGQMALDLMLQNRYDCVFMDIQMPVMDGLTAAKIARETIPHVRNIPIIAMTAHAMQEDVNKSLSAGMNAHLTKPIDLDELKKCLWDFLGPQAPIINNEDEGEDEDDSTHISK